jgi:Tol biopolymer transport system component
MVSVAKVFCETPMAHKVFISYAAEDKQIADAICNAIEAHGITCWYAPRDVPYGLDFDEAIVDAISGCRLMILILSSHSNQSQHVKNEIRNACMDDVAVPVLPFRVEDVPLNKALRYYIGAVHWLDAVTPPLESHLTNLVQHVEARLPRTAPLPTLAEPTRGKVEEPSEPALTTDESNVKRGSPAETAAKDVQPPSELDDLVSWKIVNRPIATPAAAAADAPRFTPVASSRKSNLMLLGVGGLVALIFVLAILVLFVYLTAFRPKPATNNGGSISASPTPKRTSPAVTSGTWTLDRTLNSEKGGPGSLAFSPDSKTLACVWNYVGSPTVKLIDVETGAVKHVLSSQSEWVNSLNFSPDGRLLVGTADKGIRVWDAVTGDVKQTLVADDKVGSVSFSPDGLLLASAGEDKRIIFWDTKSWQRQRTIAEGTYVEDIVFSPDGKLIASGPLIKIWDVATGQLQQTLKARDSDFPASIVFSPDGRLLVSGNLYSQTADVWEVQTARLLRTFKDFGYWVDSVDFSPEGKLLAIRSRDGTFKIYDIQTGELFQALSDVYENRSSGSDTIRFSPDGRWLAGGDGRVSFKLWKRTPT